MGTVRGVDNNAGPEWAASLPLADAAACAHLRLLDGLRVCVKADTLWLHGRAFDPDLDLDLRRIPGLVRYVVDRTADGPPRLVPFGSAVPTATLPDGDWQNASGFFLVELDAPQPAGQRPAATWLRVVRSTAERPARALRVSLEAFARWADTAPTDRLRRLTFACTPAGEALVVGTPLPPLPGIPLWRTDRLFVPCGHAFAPGIRGDLLLTVLDGGAPSTDLWLLAPDDSVSRVRAEDLVHCTRAAVRTTVAEL